MLKKLNQQKTRWQKSRLYTLIFARDTEHYWFKRRRYGWGWTPATWQGWAVVASALLLIFVNSTYMNTRLATAEQVILYTINITAVVIVLILVSYAKGPTPKWRWGAKAHDNPHEDI